MPAGLGVPGTVIVAALNRTPADRPDPEALILYRVIYHLVPLILAVLLITGLGCAARPDAADGPRP